MKIYLLQKYDELQIYLIVTQYVLVNINMEITFQPVKSNTYKFFLTDDEILLIDSCTWLFHW